MSDLANVARQPVFDQYESFGIGQGSFSSAVPMDPLGSVSH